VTVEYRVCSKFVDEFFHSGFPVINGARKAFRLTDFERSLEYIIAGIMGMLLREQV